MRPSTLFFVVTTLASSLFLPSLGMFGPQLPPGAEGMDGQALLEAAAQSGMVSPEQAAMLAAAGAIRPPVGPGPAGRVAVSGMGIADAALVRDLAAAVGPGADWQPCARAGCPGASEVMAVHRATRADATFGLYARRGNAGPDVPGFWFTNRAPSGGHLFDAEGTATGTGTVRLGDGSAAVAGLDTDAPSAASGGPWAAPFTVTGGEPGAPVPSDPRWYSRR